MRARLRDELRGLWLEPRDPRLLQLGFSLLFLLDTCLRVAGGVELSNGPLAGLVLVPLIWIVTLLLPWPRLPDGCLVVLLALDFALIGLSRLDPQGGTALLVVVPALWLGYVFGGRGAALTGIFTVAFVMLPGLVYTGPNGMNVSRAVTTTVLAVMVSLAPISDPALVVSAPRRWPTARSR